MPERTSTSARPRHRAAAALTTILIVVAVVALFAVSLLVGSPRSADPDEPFGGADAHVTGMLEEDGVQPWFEPVFEPAGGEVESGLFALQATLGGVVLGFALGRLSSRRSAA